MNRLSEERLNEIGDRVEVFEDGAMIIHSEIRQCSDYEAHLMALALIEMASALIKAKEKSESLQKQLDACNLGWA